VAKQFLNPVAIHKPRGWTHVVTAAAGTTVYVSGQIGMTPEGKVLEGLDAQAQQAYANLKAALAAAGATPADVVKETIFLVQWDFAPDKLESLRRAREPLFGERYPASTLLGVQALGRREYLVEVEVVAVIDARR